jgi:CubicO group peptidase (beta-lactamase class C family)
MSFSRRIVGLGALAFGAVGLGGGAAAQPAAEPTGPLADILKAGHAPAAGAALFDAPGVRRLDVAGLRRCDRPDPIAETDRWCLGSNTKAMTAFLYARLAAKGVVRRGATLGELFAGETLDAAWRKATIEDVMAHRAGMTMGPAGELAWVIARQADKRDVKIQRAEAARDLLAKPPAGPVGTFSYANANYIVLGAALERATGRAWEDLMRAEIFTPLKMTSAGFGPMPLNQAQGHSKDASGKVFPQPGKDNPPALGPAGTAHMSLADYGCFLRLFLGSDRTLMPLAMQTYLVTPPGGGPYALGWGVARSTPAFGNTLVLTHEGSNTMWDMFAIVLPEKGLAAAAAANIMERDTSRALIEHVVGLAGGPAKA